MINLRGLALNLSMHNELAEERHRMLDNAVREVKTLVFLKEQRQGFPLTEKQAVFYGSWLREIRVRY